MHHVVRGASLRALGEWALERRRAAVVRAFSPEQPIQGAVSPLDLLGGQESVNDDEAVSLELLDLL